MSLRKYYAARIWGTWTAKSFVTKKGQLKQTKIPINAKTGIAASSVNEDDWHTYFALATHERKALVFNDKTNLVGVDIDGCISKEGVISPFAQAVIDSCGSYTETSVSGRGIHIIGTTLKHDGLAYASKEIEIYTSGRFFTVSHDIIPHTSEEIKNIDHFLLRYAEMVKKKKVIAVTTTYADSTDKQEVLDMLSYLPSDCGYVDMWFPVVAAIHSEFGYDTVDIVNSWSPRHDLQKTVNSMSRRGGGGYSLATLVHFAKQYGYEPPSGDPETQKWVDRFRS